MNEKKLELRLDTYHAPGIVEMVWLINDTKEDQRIEVRDGQTNELFVEYTVSAKKCIEVHTQNRLCAGGVKCFTTDPEMIVAIRWKTND